MTTPLNSTPSRQKRPPSLASAERRTFWIAIVIALLFLGICGRQLFVSPIIGVANNGDFEKLTGRLHLVPDHPGSDSNFRFFVSTYHRDPHFSWDSGIRSILSPLFATIVDVGFSLNHGSFDIRWLGLLWTLVTTASLFSIVLWLGRMGAGVQLAVGAFAVWTLGDVAYVANFHSFYTDTGVLVGILVCVAGALWLCSGERTAFALAAFTAGALLVVGSKAQHAPLLLAVLCTLGLTFVRNRNVILRTLMILVAIVVGGVAVYVLRSSPTAYQTAATFNVVFNKILVHSDNISRDAEELGVQRTELRWVGHHAFEPDSPVPNEAWSQDFHRRVHFAGLLRFYLRHPGTLAQMMWNDIADQSWQMRAFNLANFRAADGAEPGMFVDELDSWSSLRRFVLFREPWVLPALYGVFFVAAMASWLGRLRSAASRGIGVAMILLFAAAVTEFGVLVSADSIETYRHFLIFHWLTDLQLACVLCASASAITYHLLGRRRAT